MSHPHVQYIELQVGISLPQAWPWRSVALAIAAAVVVVFLWSMPAWAWPNAAGHPATCPSCYALATTLVNGYWNASFSQSGIQPDEATGKPTCKSAPSHSYPVPAWVDSLIELPLPGYNGGGWFNIGYIEGGGCVVNMLVGHQTSHPSDQLTGIVSEKCSEQTRIPRRGVSLSRDSSGVETLTFKVIAPAGTLVTVQIWGKNRIEYSDPPWKAIDLIQAVSQADDRAQLQIVGVQNAGLYIKMQPVGLCGTPAIITGDANTGKHTVCMAPDCKVLYGYDD